MTSAASRIHLRFFGPWPLPPNVPFHLLLLSSHVLSVPASLSRIKTLRLHLSSSRPLAYSYLQSLLCHVGNIFIGLGARTLGGIIQLIMIGGCQSEEYEGPFERPVQNVSFQKKHSVCMSLSPYFSQNRGLLNCLSLLFPLKTPPLSSHHPHSQPAPQIFLASLH